MTKGRRLKRAVTCGLRGGVVLAVVLAAMIAHPVRPEAVPLSAGNFGEIAVQGFGDRQNSGVWSMAWWNGNLYLGTVRAFRCWADAWLHINYPIIAYPSSDPDLVCAPDPTDLPLRAEIWRFTPATATWTRVYRSPNDVPIPGHPGKFTARDIGFRTMAVFPEPGGGEALYVGGVVSNFLWPPTPPPRILRSVDGTTFEPVPQDAGTFLGNPPNFGTFRSMKPYNGRLFVVNGTVQGPGVLLESADPAAGNDSFRQVTPSEMQVFEVAVFNGFLYLGVADGSRGYAVVKTDATGTPPYRFVPVVTQGGSLPVLPKGSVVSMHVQDGRLYVGTGGPVLFSTETVEAAAGPAELIRINPDDSWDLVMGAPRAAPTGVKEPTSGMGAGFDWILNTHIWRMQDHDGVLYMGTLDGSTNRKETPILRQLISPHFGFNLYQTRDGYYVTPVTSDGFGDGFQLGLRNFASSPSGLFAGGVNYWYGLRVYRGIPSLPSVEPPTRLEVEERSGKPRLLSWEAPPGATKFRVYRINLLTDLSFQVGSARPAQLIASVTGTTFIDRAAAPDRLYHYYVVAENAAGASSSPSNLARAPSLASPQTLQGLEKTLLDWAGARAVGLVLQAEEAAAALSLHEDFAGARANLAELAQMVENDPTLLPAWRVADLHVLLGKLLRRIDLAEAGLLSVNALL